MCVLYFGVFVCVFFIFDMDTLSPRREGCALLVFVLFGNLLVWPNVCKPTQCNTLQHTALHCSTLHHSATHGNKVPNTAIHCNTTLNRMRAKRFWCICVCTSVFVSLITYLCIYLLIWKNASSAWRRLWVLIECYCCCENCELLLFVCVMLVFMRVQACHVALCCSVLQCVAVCHSVLQCVTVCCSELQCVVCVVMLYVEINWRLNMGWSRRSVLQCVAVCCSVLRRVAVHCSVL